MGVGNRIYEWNGDMDTFYKYRNRLYVPPSHRQYHGVQYSGSGGEGGTGHNKVNLSATEKYWLQFEPASESVNWAIAYIVALITLISTFTNAGVVLVYKRNPRLNYNLRNYILCLSVSDLVSSVGTNWMYAASSFKGHWSYGAVGCNLYGLVQGYCAIMSMITATVIAVERAMLMSRPTVYKHLHESARYRKGMVLGIMVYCAALTVPPVFGWNQYILEGYQTTCCFDFIDQSLNSRSFLIYISILGFFLPVILLVGSHWIIFTTLRDYRKDIANILYAAAAANYSCNSNSSSNSNLNPNQQRINNRNKSSVEEQQQKTVPQTNKNQPQANNHTNGPQTNLNNNNSACSFGNDEQRVPFQPGSVNNDNNNNCSSIVGAGTRNTGLLRKENRITIIVLLIPTGFLLTWTPYAILTFVAQFRSKNVLIGPEWLTIVSIIAKASSCINPLIYAFVDKTFRRAIYAIITCHGWLQAKLTPQFNYSLTSTQDSVGRQVLVKRRI